MICPNCQKENKDDAKFCTSCGKEIPQSANEEVSTYKLLSRLTLISSIMFIVSFTILKIVLLILDSTSILYPNSYHFGSATLCIFSYITLVLGFLVDILLLCTSKKINKMNYLVIGIVQVGLFILLTIITML